MSKRVDDTAAGRKVSAWVVMKGGKHIATVRAHFADMTVTVNVADYGKSDTGEMQFGKASGYGYDKFTAALSGLVIDGHTMADHCGERKPFPKGLDHFPRDWKEPKGWRVANFSKDTGGYMSCHKLPGLDYLKDKGYKVIQAL